MPRHAVVQLLRLVLHTAVVGRRRRPRRGPSADRGLAAGAWPHEPPSTPCPRRVVRARHRRAAAVARGQARRLSAAAADRLRRAGRRVPRRRPTTTSPRRRPPRVRSWAATVGPPTGRRPRVVVLRVYDADVPGETVTTEVEAMSTDASGTLPALLDVATLDDGRCCLVVERLGGPALSRILAERTLSPGEAVTVLAPIVVAVAELARNGLVHARLAASDVLLDDAGRPRLVGLGALRRLPADRHGAGGPVAERPRRPRRAHGGGRRRGRALRRALRAARVPPRAHGRSSVRAVRSGGRATIVRGGCPRAGARPPSTESARRDCPRASPPRWRDDAVLADAPASHDPRGGAIGAGLRRMLALAQGPDDLVDRVAAAADVDRTDRGRRRLLAILRGRGRSLAFGGLVGGGMLVVLLTLVPPATADGRSPAVAPAEPTRDAAAGRWSGVGDGTRTRRQRGGSVRLDRRRPRSRRLAGCSNVARSASRRSTSPASSRSSSRGRRSRHPIGWRCPLLARGRRRRRPGSIRRRSR